MVPKITTSGASIRSALAYDQASKNGEPPGEWVAGTLIGTPREMARQCSVFRQLRPDCKKAIWSCSLSLPPADGRREASEWGQIAEAFLKKMGVDIKTHAWAAHRHTHDNDHIHIRLCRISSAGTLWNQEHSAKRAIKACAELEGEFHLESHDRTPSKKKRPTMAEEQIFRRKGISMSRTTIQSAVDSIIAAHPKGIDFAELQALLKAQQIDVQAYAPGGVLKGVSYLHDSVKWPGSKIGSDYSVGLTSRGVRYSSEVPQADTPPAEPKKTIPQTTPGAEQVTYSVPSKSWGFDTDGGKNLIESGAASTPFAIVCVAVAELALKLARLGLEFFKAIWAWLSKKIGLVGLIGAANEATRSFRIAPRDEIIDVPSRVVPDPLLISQTASEINAVAEAVDKNDSSSLPNSAKHLSDYFAKDDSTEQKDPFAFFGDEEVLHTSVQEPAAPTAPKPWPALQLTAKAHHEAATALARARAAAAAENEDIWDMVPEAAKAEDVAHSALLKLQGESKQWLASSFANRAAAALGANPYSAGIKAAEALLGRRRTELAAAQRDQAKKPKRKYVVSAIEIIQAEKKAAEDLANAKSALVSAAKSNLANLRKNPAQMPLAKELETAIEKGIAYYVFGRDNSLLESKLQQLKDAMAAERERQNPAAYDPEAEEELLKLRAEIEASPK